MGLFKKGLKFLAEHLASELLTSAGKEVGEAIGKRLGSKIYTPPEEKEELNSERSEPETKQSKPISESEDG